MMKKYLSFVAVLFLLLGFAIPAFAQVSRAPVSIYSLSPTNGSVGTQVTIQGFGFTHFIPSGSYINGNYVVSNGKLFASNLDSPDGTSLTFTIPSGAGAYCPSGVACPMYFMQITPGSYPITVINSNGTSNAVTFTVTDNNSITVLSPNGGEQWVKGATQTIQWQDNTTVTCPTGTYCMPVQRFYDITLQPYYAPCTLSPCPLNSTNLYPYRSPYTINTNVVGTSYSWVVGKIADSGGTALDGSYTVQVCQSGTSICDSSNGPFTIVSGTSSNQPPVISSVGGPTSLNIGEIGTWNVKASDPDGTYLTYSVDFGDVFNYTTGSAVLAPPTQTSTFTHSYSQAGNYKLLFTVSDNAGGSAQSSLTVAVGPQTPIVLTEGGLVKIFGQPTVYLVIGGVLRPFTSSVVFLARGLLWSNVQQVSSGQVSQQAISTSPVLLPDGSLIKASSPTVFIVLGGKKFGIPSLEVFNRLGLSFKNVVIVSDGDVQGYPDGGIQY